MSSGIIYSKVLALNASWRHIGTTTVKEALEDLSGAKTPKKALKIEYERLEDGSYDFSKPIEIIPLDWNEWIKLEPRSFDKGSIRTVNYNIRIPTVIISPNYNKIVMKKLRATKRNIYDHYEGKCAYTGRQLSFKEATLDHVYPKSKGGADSWDNLVLADTKINNKKSDRTLKEANLELLYKPSAPKAVASSYIIKAALHPDWHPFIKV